MTRAAVAGSSFECSSRLAASNAFSRRVLLAGARGSTSVVIG